MIPDLPTPADVCAAQREQARADLLKQFTDIPDTFRLLAISTEHEVTRAAYLFAADLVASRIDQNTRKTP